MFKEKFYSDIRKKLYEIMAITFERYLSLVRMDEKEFDQKSTSLKKLKLSARKTHDAYHKLNNACSRHFEVKIEYINR